MCAGTAATAEEIDERIVEIINVAADTASELAATMDIAGAGAGGGDVARVAELSARYAGLCDDVHRALTQQAAAIDAQQTLPPQAQGVAPPLPASAAARRSLAIALRRVDAVCEALEKLRTIF